MTTTETLPEIRPQRPRRRLLRRLGRLTLIAAALLVTLSITAYLVTPSVGNAQQLTAALAREHDAPYQPNDRVPTYFADALLATEDSRFYHHPGIDPIGAVRGIAGPLLGKHGDQGGATIEQQLAKVLYSGGRDAVPQKAEHVVLAVKLDLDYSKQQILAMYAAAVYFGDGAYGLTNAACHYFGTSASELTWGQAAMLAGLVQAPSAYDPLTNLPAARARQQHVLQRLVATGHLSQAAADSAFTAPLGLHRTAQC